MARAALGREGGAIAGLAASRSARTNTAGSRRWSQRRRFSPDLVPLRLPITGWPLPGIPVHWDAHMGGR